MVFNMETKLDDLYSDWLMEHCIEAIHCSDDLNELFENNHEKESFVDEVMEILKN
ncbi:MAG: hypothetical protein KAX49_13080 [Halanaerobiales bacterium]|nr:hypothetical protein [Halanaerobiales bacterium]